MERNFTSVKTIRAEVRQVPAKDLRWILRDLRAMKRARNTDGDFSLGFFTYRDKSKRLIKSYFHGQGFGLVRGIPFDRFFRLIEAAV